MEFFGFACAIVMGLILGLIGGGGSILTVPILVYLFGIAPTQASGQSLFVVGVTALFSAIAYFRRQQIDFKAALLFALPSLIGVSLARAWIIPALPETLLHINGWTLTKDLLIMVMFAALMLSASISMLKRSSSPTTHNKKQGPVKIALGALLIGLITGTVGAGGGFLIVPALIYLAGLDIKKAVGTSLTIMVITSLIGFAVDQQVLDATSWTRLLSLAGLAIMGATAGSLAAHRANGTILKKFFGYFVLITGSLILLQQILSQ